MSPTINPGDHFASIGFKNDDLDPIERFDIVVFKRPKSYKRDVPEDTRYAYRVIALGGEKVELKKGIVFINDAQLEQSSFEKLVSTDDFKPIVVPAGEFFLMGDNRSNAEDSRFIGTIKRDAIDGKVRNIIRKEDYDKGKRW